MADDRTRATAVVNKLVTDGLMTSGQATRLDAAATRLALYSRVDLYSIAQITDEGIRAGLTAESVVDDWETTPIWVYMILRMIRGSAT